MKLIFIVNPAAKNGRARNVWRKLEKLLQNRNIPHDVLFTAKAGDGTTLARNVLARESGRVMIVAVGGDGTIHEVINGIESRDDVVIGYIPAGTGNDFARGTTISRHAEKALHHLLSHPPVSRYDIGTYSGSQISEGQFVNNIGCGFDAHIAQKVNASKWKPFFNRLFLGKFVYVFYLVKELFFYQPTRIRLQVDGESYTFERAWFVTIANHPYYGGGMKIAPFAKADDGALDVVVVHNVSRLKILLLFVTVFWGGHQKMKEVTMVVGKEIHVDADDILPLHADGESIGAGNITVSAGKTIHIIANGSINTTDE
ncbi:MAG: diacylglycerol kinase family lipid kinase [Anoxybacillus sp.]|nr:diacylglycerol kinase family protein [Anoxybacillus sp.]MCL6587405.1 diacylglycerol kinase family lipid kinase [Anoxybacillus sp.]